MSRLGLADLEAVVLDARARALLADAAKGADGHRAWRERKCAEARDLLALAAIAGRMRVERLGLAGDLCAIVRLRAPVPVRDGDAVAVAPAAVLGLRYPVEATLRALKGTEFVVVLAPRFVFHPNVAPGPQVLCTGRLPIGVPATEIVMLAYRALTLQACALDAEDPAGVLNPDAARYWQQHAARLPLTRAAFLEAEVEHA
jgi:hypothetical protein